MVIRNYLGTLFLAAIVPLCATARTFTHPGLSYTQGDLDRMRAMVAAQEEPFYTTFQRLKSSSFSRTNATEFTRGGALTNESSFEATVGIDGRRATDLALLYRITDDENYARAAVVYLNANSWYTNTCNVGTAALDNGKFKMLIEAAELLRDYPGWAEEDRQRFRDMLVYPGYSSTDYPWNEHPGSTRGPYWGVYNFDCMRYGNQGLIGCGAMLAMGVFLDNEKIFDRGIRYLRAQPHRADDLPYVSGPANLSPTPKWTGETLIEYSTRSPNVFHEYEDWGYDEQLRHYIYPNGQCQESCRDQGHAIAGLTTYDDLAEVAWNQGVDLWGELDNRILLGLEWCIRLNLTGYETYPDQPEAWEPTGVTRDISEISFDNGLFYRVRHRSGRWESLWIATDRRDYGATSYVELPLNHYAIRAGVDESKMKWLRRAQARVAVTAGGIETCQSGGGGYGGPGWGTLTKRRLPRMAGDPGIWTNGVRISGIHRLPGTIAARDYDWYSDETAGEGHTYHVSDPASSNGLYRTEGAVPLREAADGIRVTDLMQGDWLQYTVAEPEGGLRPIRVTYAASQGATLALQIDENNPVSLALPANATSAATEIRLAKGAHVLRLTVSATKGTVELAALTFSAVTGRTLVWNGASGKSWTDANVWTNSLTGAAMSYADGEDVRFAALNGSSKTNTIALSGSVHPGTFAAELPVGRALQLTGSGTLTVTTPAALAGGAFVFANTSNDFTRLVCDSAVLGCTAGTTVLRAIEGSGEFALGSNGRLVLPGQSIPEGIKMTGAGTLVPVSGTVGVSSLDTFSNFAGTIRVGSGAQLRDDAPYHDASTAFGTASLVRLEGGSLSLGWKCNNNTLPVLEVPANETGTIYNTSSASQHGQNVNVSRPFRGAGTLTLECGSRSLSFNGSLADFTGTLRITGWDGDYRRTYLNTTQLNDATEWVHLRRSPFVLNMSADSSITFGALTAAGSTEELSAGHSNLTLTFGGRSGATNYLDTAITGYPLHLVKTGATPLMLGTHFACATNNTLTVNAGTLRVVPGAALDALELAPSTPVEIIADHSWTNGGSYTVATWNSVSGRDTAVFTVCDLAPGLSATATAGANALVVTVGSTDTWDCCDETNRVYALSANAGTTLPAGTTKLAADTLVFDRTTMIAEGTDFAGRGDIIVTNATLSVTGRADSSNNSFRDFYGNVIIGTNGLVRLQAPSFCSDAETLPPLGHGTLYFAGGRLFGFPKRNNVVMGPVCVSNNTSSVLENTAANSQSGVNLKFNGPLTGSGKLELKANGRWMQFNAANTAFHGTLRLTGSSTQSATFTKAEAGMPYGTVVVDAPRALALSTAAYETIAFGGLVLTNANARLAGSANGRLGLGRSGVDSILAVPVEGPLAEISKIGLGALRLRPGFSIAATTLFAIEGGSLALADDALATNVVTMGTGTLLAGNGTIGNLTLANGSSVSNGVDEVLVATAASVGDFTKRGDGRLVLPCGGGRLMLAGGAVTVPRGASFTSVASTGGAVEIDVSDIPTNTFGTVQLLALTEAPDDATVASVRPVGLPATNDWRLVSSATGIYLRNERLVWNGGRGDDWNAPNAWKGESSGEVASFADGDQVVLRNGAQLTLKGACVRPASVVVDGTVTLVGGGRISSAAYSGNTLVVTNDASVLTLDLPLGGTVRVAEGSCVVAPAGRSLTGLVLADGARYLAAADDTWHAGESRKLVDWVWANGAIAEAFGVRDLPNALAADVSVVGRCAMAALSTTFVDVSRADVLSLNFGCGFLSSVSVSANSVMSGYTPENTLAGGIPGAAWNNLYDTVGSNVVCNVAWKGAEAAIDTTRTPEVTYTCGNLYGVNGETPNFMRNFLDDWTPGEIELVGLGTEPYDVVVYAQTDSSSVPFRPVTVNGTMYTWDASAQRAIEGTGNWGRSSSTSVVAGVNALFLTNIVADTLAVTGTTHVGGARGGISALQVVRDMPLIWNGTAASVLAAGAWDLYTVASDYDANRGLAFTVRAFGTNANRVSATIPSGLAPKFLFAEIPAGKSACVAGAGQISTALFTKRGEGSFVFDCPTDFTDIRLHAGDVTIATGTFTVRTLEALAAFRGSLTIDHATLDPRLPLHGEGTQPMYGLGADTTLRLRQGTLASVGRGTNNTRLPTIEILDGTTNVIYNTSSRSASGVNLTLDRSLSGAGRLEIVCRDRSLTFLEDASGFTGTLAVSGTTGGYNPVTSLRSSAALNAGMTFEYTRRGTLMFAPGEGESLHVQKLIVSADCPGVTIADRGMALTLHGGGTLASPFTGEAFALVVTNGARVAFTGAATLPLGTQVTVDGGEVTVDSSALKIYGGVSSITSGTWTVLEIDGTRYLCSATYVMSLSACSIRFITNDSLVVSNLAYETLSPVNARYRLWISTNLVDWAEEAVATSAAIPVIRRYPCAFYRFETLLAR